MNQPWFRLMSTAAKLAPGGPVNNAEKLMFGNGSAGYFTCVFEAKSGKGSVLFSGLNLTSETHRNMPESAYLLDQMIRYVASEDFSPTGSVASSIFEGFVTLATLRELNGFDKIIETIPAQKTSYNSGFFGVLPSHFIRQTDGKGIISWRSKPLTKENISDDGEASFQWPATTGWVTDPAGDFTLLVNGKELLKFDVSNTTKSWQIPGQPLQSRTGLAYDIKGFTPTGDSTGIMTLTLPADTVKVGESIEIGVKGSASNSKRFFMLYETP